MTNEGENPFVARIERLRAANDLVECLARGTNNAVVAGPDEQDRAERPLEDRFYVFSRQEAFAKRLLMRVADGFRSRDYTTCTFHSEPKKVVSEERKVELVLQHPSFPELQPAGFEVLLGLPGTGKSATVQRVLRLLAEVMPRSLQGNLQQIPYVAISCNADATHKGFCSRILSEFDKASGNTDWQHVFAHSYASEEEMPKRIVQLARSYALGCIVFDDLQALLRVSDQERLRILRLLFSLADGGIPVILLGKPPAMELIEKYPDMLGHCFDSVSFWDCLPNDAEWASFVDAIWPSANQVCTEHPEVSADFMHMRTQGLPGLVHALVRTWLRNTEFDDAGSNGFDLQQLADRVLMPLAGPLRALASEDPLACLSYPDFVSPEADQVAKERNYREKKRAEAIQHAAVERQTREQEQDEIDEIVLDEETRKKRAARLEAASNIVMRQILREAHLPPQKVEERVRDAWDSCKTASQRTRALMTYAEAQIKLHRKDVGHTKKAASQSANWAASDLRAVLSGAEEPHAALRKSGYAGPRALEF